MKRSKVNSDDDDDDCSEYSTVSKPDRTERNRTARERER